MCKSKNITIYECCFRNTWFSRIGLDPFNKKPTCIVYEYSPIPTPDCFNDQCEKTFETYQYYICSICFLANGPQHYSDLFFKPIMVHLESIQEK